MEDDQIKKLFSEFNPEVPSQPFMSQLLRNMEAVEFVRQRSAAIRRRNRLAVIIAALAGFAVGVICTVLTPVIADMLPAILADIPALDITPGDFDFRIIGWVVAAAATAFTAINTYLAAMTRLPDAR